MPYDIVWCGYLVYMYLFEIYNNPGDPGPDFMMNKNYIPHHIHT